MSQPNTNSKNASFDDNFVPSMLAKDPVTNETVAITAVNGQLATGGTVMENNVPTIAATSTVSDVVNIVTQ
jgi:hypothetical protein